MKSHLAEISNSSTEAPSPLTGGKKWNAPVARKVSGSGTCSSLNRCSEELRLKMKLP